MVLNPDLRAKTKIWQYPEEGRSYTIGVDVAEGIIREARNDLAVLSVAQLPDFSVAFVLCNETNEQVATLRCLEDTVKFSKRTMALYLMYFEPVLVVEANGPGIAVLNALEMLGARHFYYRFVPDKTTNMFAKKKGFRTTQNTRELLIKDAIESITDEDGIRVVGKNALTEMKSFVRNRNGKAEAAPGAKDDEVFAMMLAIQGRKQHWRKKVEETPKYQGHPDGWVWRKFDDQVKAFDEHRKGSWDEEEALYDKNEIGGF